MPKISIDFEKVTKPILVPKSDVVFARALISCCTPVERAMLVKHNMDTQDYVDMYLHAPEEVTESWEREVDEEVARNELPGDDVEQGGMDCYGSLNA